MTGVRRIQPHQMGLIGCLMPAGAGTPVEWQEARNEGGSRGGRAKQATFPEAVGRRVANAFKRVLLMSGAWATTNHVGPRERMGHPFVPFRRCQLQGADWRLQIGLVIGSQQRTWPEVRGRWGDVGCAVLWCWWGRQRTPSPPHGRANLPEAFQLTMR